MPSPIKEVPLPPALSVERLARLQADLERAPATWFCRALRHATAEPARQEDAYGFALDARLNPRCMLQREMADAMRWSSPVNVQSPLTSCKMWPCEFNFLIQNSLTFDSIRSEN